MWFLSTMNGATCSQGQRIFIGEKKSICINVFNSVLPCKCLSNLNKTKKHINKFPPLTPSYFNYIQLISINVALQENWEHFFHTEIPLCAGLWVTGFEGGGADAFSFSFSFSFSGGPLSSFLFFLCCFFSFLRRCFSSLVNSLPSLYR